MKISKKIISITIACLCLLFTFKSCSLDEVWYSEVTPDTFFTSRANVLAFKNRPFTHFRWFVEGDRWLVQEVTTDAFTAPTRDGTHWWDGGAFMYLHHHTWNPDNGRVWETWRGGTMGIALALQTMEVLADVDYEALGMTNADREMHLMQLQVLKAYFYLRLLDAFGGVPVFFATNEQNVPRATDRETFNHIENLLLEAIPHLPRKTTLGATEQGIIHQAAAATLLARLYFNAIAYINEDRFADAARVSQRILNGEYGAYALGATWDCVHNFDNERSPEMIWNTPSQNGFLQFSWWYATFNIVNARDFYDIRNTPRIGNGNNGWCLMPSRDYMGNLLPYRMGGPFERFHDLDVRKRQYRYLGGGQREGMFVVGELRNPRTGDPVLGGQGMAGQPLTIVDFIARPFPWDPQGINHGPMRSTILDGQENQGIRLAKVPVPNDESGSALLWGASNPIMRLAEVYFMLAESEMRAGNLGRAAELINTVRARNFEGADPDPVTAANLDSYRMLDEWLIEFLGEGRRRTDLIRWDKFVTRPWWNFTPHNDRTRHRFPIPQRAITGSGGILEQNPGYDWAIPPQDER